MPRRAARSTLAVVGALLALGPFAAISAAGPATRTASAGGACPDQRGITVVVDASAFGDGVQVRCAPQPVRSGFEALTKAGFTFQGTTQYPGLLCRIDGEPASDPCHSAPPANAYWAYWHAPRGGEWTYSTSGAGSRVPPPGSVEGWAFGDDARPGIDPPPPAETTTTTARAVGRTPTPPRPAAAAAVSPSITVDAGGDPTSSTTTPTSDTTSTSTTARAAAPGRDGIDSDDRSRDEAAAAPSPAAGDAGSPAGALVGISAVAAIGGAAVAVARRRRSADGAPIG
ncbi:MAG: hypothetical protein ACJ739_15455 [Acidimicrobiales bacterium]